MKKIIEDALKTSMTYEVYMELVKSHAIEKKTTGEATQEKIEFTKLNYSRSKRLDKTLTLSDKQVSQFKNNDSKKTWLVITESWCGDAAQTLPILNKISKTSDAIELKIVLRDENVQLMDAFLTNGSMSIPKLIMLDDSLEVVGQWGPRSAEATRLVVNYKKKYGMIDSEFKRDLQVWYNLDRGQSIINDLIAKVNRLEPVEEIVR